MSTEAKICGIRSEAALDAALEGGARYIGLVIFPTSPRNVDLATATRLADRARGKAKVVALLVDPDDALVQRVAEDVQPDFLQLHGAESPLRVKDIRRLSGIPIIKAVGVSGIADVTAAIAYFEPGHAADIVLFDAKPPKDATRTGGHGKAFDWSVLQDLPQGLSWMLSGGLTPDNVAEAIRVTGATQVDVSSGVESAPGVKDPEMIRRFLRAVKTAKQN
jgi:phosphoribosylanthranilate isomerase